MTDGVIAHAEPFDDAPVVNGRLLSKVSYAVAAEIVHQIVEHDMKPGDRLPTETEMLRAYDVGRSSLREALRVLEVYGVIEVRRGKSGGPFVVDVTPSNLGQVLSLYLHLTGGTYADVLESRVMIEPMMARLAAERRSPEGIRRLETALAAEASGSYDDPEYVRLAHDFHGAICRMSGNLAMDMLSRSLRTVHVGRSSGRGAFRMDERPHARHLHLDIGTAVLEGRADAAEQLMRSHMRALANREREVYGDGVHDRIRWPSPS